MLHILLADDHDIGLGVEVVGRVAFPVRDTELPQLVGHGRVDVFVGAGHLVAGRPEQSGQRAHRGAADADQMVMPLHLVHGR